MPTWFDKLLNSQFVQLGLAALAFLIALWLVVVIARMLMGGRLRLPGGRTRQARLGIVDAFDLDRQRQLIIVRRDNTEHLIMIGGPNDLLIESEIVRVEARDFREGRRDKGFETSGEGRVPAPFAAQTIGAPAIAPAMPRQDEPLLPMALPQTAPEPVPVQNPESRPESRPEPVVARTPTFPLPSRRPPPPAASDRRSLPGPAERIAPTVEPLVAPQDGLGPRPPGDEASAVMTPLAGPAPTGSPAIPNVDPQTRPGVAARPPSPLLRPMPPRAPIRPLKRITPQPEPLTGTTCPGTPRAICRASFCRNTAAGRNGCVGPAGRSAPPGASSKDAGPPDGRSRASLNPRSGRRRRPRLSRRRDGKASGTLTRGR